MKENDARVVGTRGAIRESFISLLRKKPVSRITVKEICEHSKINRSTFYNHYADPLDVLEKLETEVLDELRDRLNCPFGDMEEFLIKVLSGILEYGDIYMTLASRNGDPALYTKVFACCFETVAPRFERHLPDATPTEREMMLQFLIHGSGGVLSAWMRTGCKEPKEKIAVMLHKLIGG